MHTHTTVEGAAPHLATPPVCNPHFLLQDVLGVVSIDKKWLDNDVTLKLGYLKRCVGCAAPAWLSRAVLQVGVAECMQ